MDRVDKIAKMLTEDPDVFINGKQTSKKKKKYVVEVSKKPILEEKKEKTEPSNKPDDEVFGKEFRTLLGLEDKPEPADPSKKDRNQKSPNNSLEGAEQTGKTYLEWQPDPSAGGCPGCKAPLMPDGGSIWVGGRAYCPGCARKAKEQQQWKKLGPGPQGETRARRY